MDDASSVQRRKKGSATKSAIPCPTIVKLYNNCLIAVDLMDQWTAAYQLDPKSSVCFYLRIFYGFLVSNMKHLKQLTLTDCKLVMAKNLIRWHQNCQSWAVIKAEWKKEYFSCKQGPRSPFNRVSVNTKKMNLLLKRREIK